MQIGQSISLSKSSEVALASPDSKSAAMSSSCGGGGGGGREVGGGKESGGGEAVEFKAEGSGLTVGTRAPMEPPPITKDRSDQQWRYLGGRREGEQNLRKFMWLPLKDGGLKKEEKGGE